MSYYSWLQQVVAPYADPNRVFNDVDNVLKRYPTLKPRTDNYTRMMPPHPLLIVLSGTIPVSYMQQIFNIPVELWMPHLYPRTPPIAYVTPTSEMMLKPGGSVSNDGMFYSSMFMNYWQSNPNASLWDLVEAMKAQFAQEMPVFSGRQTQSTGYYGQYPQPIPSPPLQQPQQQFPPYSSGYVPSQLQSFPMNPAPLPRTTPPPQQQQQFASNKDAEMHELRAIIKNKIAAKIQERQAEAAEGMERLMEDGAKLSENEHKLDESVAKLKSEIQRIQKAIDDFKKVNKEAQHTEIDIDKVDVEGLMHAQGEVSRQLLELALQEMSIADCLYAINKAFFDNPNLIGINPFIKAVRSLAREQFMAKAHIQKIRQLYPVMP